MIILNKFKKKYNNYKINNQQKLVICKYSILNT